MGIESQTTGRASRNRNGACTRGPASQPDLSIRVDSGGVFLFPPWLAQLLGLPNGRVAADGSPGRTDNGRIVRDFKMEPIAREV